MQPTFHEFHTEFFTKRFNKFFWGATNLETFEVKELA